MVPEELKIDCDLNQRDATAVVVQFVWTAPFSYWVHKMLSYL